MQKRRELAPRIYLGNNIEMRLEKDSHGYPRWNSRIGFMSGNAAEKLQATKKENIKHE